MPRIARSCTEDMADNQNRTLPATERKIAKAREDGQVARSRDLGHFAALFSAGLVIVALAPQATHALKRVLAQALRFDAATLAGTGSMTERLLDLGLVLMAVVAPLGLLMVLVGVASGMASGGWIFSLKALEPRWDKFDPIAGLKRMVSGQQVGQMLKACLLAVLLGVIAALFVKANLARFAHTLALPLPAAFEHAGSAIWAGVVLLLVALGVFALVDVPLQRFIWLRGLRMSHEEVKKEFKDVEGSPEIKAKMKARMREMANRRMLAAVPRADLVVMNPEHYAVALKYDGASMAAPIVLAKGADLMAFRIRDAARAAAVPVLQAPPLARALYAHAQIDREIPAALFAAVAQVLAWVYQLRNAMAGRGREPGPLPDLPVPPELDPQNPAAQDPRPSLSGGDA
jgi:flagellar biosynthetic protein FlhB